MAVLITFGNDSKLKLKVPAKGETNWAEDFKTYFVDPIVEHDHSGVNGRGKQLGPTSLADDAIESRHVNFGLTDLNGVIGSNPQSGQFLKFDGGNWQPGSIDPTVKELTSGDPSATGGIGDSNSGVDLSANSEIYISDVTDTDTIDFSARTPATLTGIKFIIDSATVANKKIKFNNLKDCIIISNLDIEVVGTIDKCIIIMENDDATVGSEGANLTLLSNDTAPNNIVTASRIIADTIEVSNATTADKNLFVDSEIKIKQLNLQLLGGSDTNKSRIIRSHVEVNDRITNTNTISGSTGQKLFLEDSKVSFPLFQENVSTSATTYSANTSELSVDDDSELKQITTNLIKIWKQSDNRWNYLVSPSAKGALISSDSSGVPTQINVGSNNQVLTANSSTSTGLEWQSQSATLATASIQDLGNVNTSGVSSGQFLKYDGANWVDTSILQVPSGGSTGQILTKTSSGYAWQNGESTMRIRSSGKTTVSAGTNTSIFSSSTIPSGCYAQVSIRLSVDGDTNLQTGEDSNARFPAVLTLGPGNTCAVNWFNNTINGSMHLNVAGQFFEINTGSFAGTLSVDYVVFENS